MIITYLKGLTCACFLITESIKRLNAVDWVSFFTKARLHSMSKDVAIARNIESGCNLRPVCACLYASPYFIPSPNAQSAFYTRVRILYPVRNA